jgi:hypothetical protein
MQDLAYIAQFAALLGAALFFGYKALTGYLRINLSLSIECQRQKNQTKGTDTLAIVVHLKKGENGSLTLHDAQARIKYGEQIDLRSFGGLERSSANTMNFGEGQRKTLDWSSLDNSSPLLKLIPGEEVQLSIIHEVPTDAVCLIEVAVLGERTNSPSLGQWKASNVSLPLRHERG